MARGDNNGASTPEERLDALRCIKALVVLGTAYKIIDSFGVCAVLILTRNEVCEAPLKIFLFVYTLISIARTAIFVSKNERFFEIDSIPEYRENADMALFSNFIEALLLFWYLIGFNWLQECKNCKLLNPLLYYVSYYVVIFGFITFILPLLAIIILIALVTCIRPKLNKVIYKDEKDVPNDTYYCAICYENYEPNVELQILPCDHHFHTSCIDEWLNMKDACPLCKKNINLIYDIIDP